MYFGMDTIYFKRLSPVARMKKASVSKSGQDFLLAFCSAKPRKKVTLCPNEGSKMAGSD